MSSDFDLVGEVTAIVKQFANASGTDGRERDRVRQALAALPQIDMTDRLTPRYQEYEIRPGFNMHLEREAQMLKWLRGLNLSIAPECVALLPLAEAQGVLIRRYWACPGETLSHLKMTDVPLRPEAKERAMADLETLAKHGCIHSQSRDLSRWLVSSQTGTLVLDNWLAMRQADNEREARWVLDAVGAQLKAR